MKVKVKVEEEEEGAVLCFPQQELGLPGIKCQDTIYCTDGHISAICDLSKMMGKESKS